MAENSKIEWTDCTWSPVTGCTRVSAGCDHCYSARLSKRLAAMGQKKYQGIVGNGHFNGVVKTWDDELTKPLRWKKPRMIFVNSMSDTFHKDVSFEFITALFGVMAACPQHTFQVLTKRPERMAEWATTMQAKGGIGVYIRSDDGRKSLRPLFDAVAKIEVVYGKRQRANDDPWMQVMNGAGCNYGSQPLSNVWLGTSVEDQQRADERIPHLLRCPAAVRFLSCEPLLGPINLDSFIGYADGDPINWIICGGESGPGARPCDLEWIESIRDQCRAAGVACFIKQLGAHPVSTIECLLSEVRDRKGGDWLEWPEGLRVREYPATVGPAP